MSYIFHDMVLPHDLQESIDNYVQYGIPAGGFLEAVIDNDLSEACGRADDTNIKILPVIVAYFYNECPSGAWGFPGAHDRWVKRKLDERKNKAAEGN